MNEGFFKFPTILPPKGQLKHSEFNESGEPFCKECGLDRQCKSPKLDYHGKGKKGILVIGEASGYWEDTKGQQWQGDVGKFLDRKLIAHGIKLFEDCWCINAVGCRPPDNRKPKKKEIQCCKPWVLGAIEETKPEHIWLCGGAAIESFYMDELGSTAVTRWRGLHIPDQEFKCWIHPMYHPSYAMRSEKDRYLMATYDRDLRNAVEYLGKPFKVAPNYENDIIILYKADEVIAYLDYLIEDKPPIVIDYETTGLKPYKKDHKIYCAGIADDAGAVVFPLQRPGEWDPHDYTHIEDKFVAVLNDPDINKTIQNLAYEYIWSTVKLNADPQSMNWCTMVNSHLVDDRAGYCGLKFQTYINFGVKGYDNEIAPYLESDGEYNRISEAPPTKLHTYCGYDCLYTRDLRKVQEEIFRQVPPLQEAADFYNGIIHTFARMSMRGFGCDEEYLITEWDRLTNRMEIIEQKLMASPEAQAFYNSQGRSIKLSSGPDLRILLFDLLGAQSIKKTKKKEQESTDEEVLKQIGIPFTEKLLLSKKLKKIRDTYLSQFRRASTHGRIHTDFNLHIARTFRSSSSDPNIHNIPRRNEMAKKSCRRAIVPSKGHRLIESDYSAMEVNIAGCYTEDPVWVAYCRDPKSDMHKDEGAEIFKMDPKQVTKDIRDRAKNEWVFPQLYGSYYANCAPNLWESCVASGFKTEDGVQVREWLQYKGIDTLSQFVEWCKKHEKDYWDKYKATKKWQQKVLADYLDKGYVTTYFGHRRYGYLTPNAVINTPIQGTATHCLFWSCHQIDEISLQESWTTKLIGQIHDSMMNDTYPPEQEMVVETIRQVAEKDIVDTYKWIIVPLIMDFEFTPIDASWYDKVKVEQDENGDFYDKEGRIYNLTY